MSKFDGNNEKKNESQNGCYKKTKHSRVYVKF